MSTTVPDAVPAPAPSPVETVHLADLLYSHGKADAAPQQEETTPEPTPDTDTSLTSETTPATPPVEAKTDEPQKADEDKREESQRAAAARLGREVQEIKGKFEALAEENRILKAKLDGTYEEPVEPTPQQIAHRAEFEGRERASRAVAEQAFGAEAVQATIYDKDSPFQLLVKAKPEVQIEVMRAAQPAVTAMRILARERFIEKYGTDAEQWVAKIIEEQKPKLLKELQQQAAKPPVGQPPPSVSDARSASGNGAGRKEKSLAHLLYG